MAPRAAVRRRRAHRLHDRRGPAAARARHRVRRQPVAVRRGAGRRRVGAQVPAARARRGRATSPASRWSRTSSASSSTTRAGASSRRKAHAEAATSRRRARPAGRRRGRAPTRPRATRRASTCATRSTRGPRLVLASEDFRTAGGEPLPYDKRFLLESVTARPGDPYTLQAVHEDSRRLERLLGDAGYPSSSVDPDVNRTGDRVALTWVLKLGRARARRADLRARQLQDHARDHPGADPAAVRAAT